MSENNSQRVLFELGISPDATVDSQTGIDLELATRPGGIKVLQRHWTLPAFHKGIRVNAGRGIEQIGLIGDDRHRRQRLKSILQQIAVGRIVDDLGVHLVIRWRPIPRGGQAGRHGGLDEDVVQEHVSLSIDIGRCIGWLERGGAHCRRAIDRDRAGIAVAIGLCGQRARRRRCRCAHHREVERIGGHIRDDEHTVVLGCCGPPHQNPIAIHITVTGDRRGRDRAASRDAGNRLSVIHVGRGRAIQRVANGRVRSRRADGQREWLRIETAIHRKLSILHPVPVLRRIGRAGCRYREEMRAHALVDDLGQFGQHQQVAVCRRDVHRLDRQHISGGLQQMKILRHIDVLESDGLRVRVLRCGRRIVRDRRRRIAPRNFHSVQISNVSVIIFHLQRQ